MAEQLERRSTESRAAYRALLDYAAMGGRRSLRDLLAEYVRRSSDDRLTEHPPTTKWGTLSTWSLRHDWQSRIAAYDTAQAAQERVQREVEQAQRRTAWVARHMGPDELLARLADQARGTLADVLALPEVEEGEEEEEGLAKLRGNDHWVLDLVKAQQTGAIHVIKKIKQTKYGTEVELHDAHAAQVKLGEHLGLFKQPDDILKYIDLSKLSAEQLQRIADGESPLAVLLANNPVPPTG